MTGRPPFEPTVEQHLTVRIMASCGFPQEQIADHIKVDRKTLRKHFKADLDEGLTTANAIVAQSLFKKATGSGTSAVTAAIWWEKTRAGKKEVTGHEHTGKDGESLAVSWLAALKLIERPDVK